MQDIFLLFIHKSLNLGKKLLLFIVTIFVVVSCEKQEPIVSEIENQDIRVEESYLVFSTQNDFDNYLTQISIKLDSQVNLKSSNLISQPNNFRSLADKINDAEKRTLKSSSNESFSFKELFEAELLKELIPDHVLPHVLDTAARVKIGGEIYHITELGTFIYKPYEYDSFTVLCETFLQDYSNYDSKIDSVTYLYGNVKFIDTYTYLAEDKMDQALDLLVANVALDYIQEDTQSSLKSASLSSSTSDFINSSYTNTYNLTTHNGARHTIVGKGVDKLSGEWHKRNVSSRKRVRCKLFSVNYGFYKNSGFKVDYQIQQVKTMKVGIGRWKKTITIKGLWVKTDAPKMVVGVDFFQGYTEMTTFGLDKYYQDNYDQIKDYSKKWSNQFVKMVYAGVLKEPTNIAKGWVSDKIDIFDATAKIKILGNSYNLSEYEKKAIEEAFDKARDEGIKQLKKKTYDFVYEQLGGDVNKPKAMFIPGGANKSNREYLILEGLNSYSNKHQVNTNFGSPSFGLKLSWSEGSGWSMPGGFTPNKFVVEKAYVFGAVYDYGKWTGIRLYLD
jgi:hypothetical protein